MIKWLGILFTVLQSFQLFCTETDVLNELYNRINEYDNAGAHSLVLEHSRRLYDLATICQDDSLRLEYRCKALLFQLDYYRKIDSETFSSIFKSFEKEILQGKRISFGNLYGYYINKAEFLNRIDSAFKVSEVLDVLNKAEYLVLTNPSLIENSSLPFYRMMIQFRKGDAFLKQNQFSLARSHYMQALSSAQQADSLKWIAEKKYWGYEQARLVDLFKLAVVSDDPQSLNTALDRIQLRNRESIYQNMWDRDLIRAVLAMDKVQTDQINMILTKLTSNDLLSKDPIIFIKISHYFLQHDYQSKSIYYRDKATALLPLFKSIANVQLEYNLLLAAIALKNCQYTLGDSLIQACKQWLLSPDGSQLKGSRQDYLTFMQQAMTLYIGAYQLSKDTLLLSECAQLTDEAVQSLYYLRLDLPEETDRLQLLSQLKGFTNLALYNYYELFKYTKPDKTRLSHLLNYFESNKSFNLFVAQNLPIAEREKLSGLKIKLLAIDHQLLASVGFTDSLMMLKSSLIDSITNIWQRSHPDFKMMNIESIQALIANDQTIIEYFNFSDTYMYALIINRDRVDFRQLSYPSSPEHQNISEEYIHLGNLISDFAIDKMHAITDYKEVSYRIYKALILPVDPYLNKKVLIVPEANMSNLPWGALLTMRSMTMDCREWPFWIKSHSIATLHSLSIWSGFKADDPGKTSAFDLPFIAFGPTFADLDNNIEECNTLQKMMGGTVYVDSLATKNVFLNVAKSSRIIHIASHAQASAVHQDSSFIRFAGSTMYNQDISRQSLPTDLVFLSACETGIGKVIKDEGVFSLARAFFSAGAKAVISTLWKVNDRVARNQVEEIYRYILHGNSKDEAIRKMQLHHIDKAPSAESAFPFYWAGFQCQGDLKPLESNSFMHLATNIWRLVPVLTYSLCGLGGYLFYDRKYLWQIIERMM